MCFCWHPEAAARHCVKKMFLSFWQEFNCEFNSGFWCILARDFKVCCLRNEYLREFPLMCPSNSCSNIIRSDFRRIYPISCNMTFPNFLAETQGRTKSSSLLTLRTCGMTSSVKTWVYQEPNSTVILHNFCMCKSQKFNYYMWLCS